MRQTGIPWRGARSSVTAQIFALDKKMRPRYTSQLELLQVNRRSQVRPSLMMNLFFLAARLRCVGASRARPVLFEDTALIQDLGRNRRPGFCHSRFLRPFFPHGREVARGPVLINQP